VERYTIRESDISEERKNAYLVNANAVHLDDGTLKGRYGKKDNPFISPFSLLDKTVFMTIELTLKNASPASVRVPYEKTTLLIEGNEYTPVSRPDLSEYWVNKHRHGESREQRITASMQERIYEEVLPDTVTIGPNSVEQGLIVYRGKDIPLSGMGTLRVFFFTEEREIIDGKTAEFTF